MKAVVTERNKLWVPAYSHSTSSSFFQEEQTFVGGQFTRQGPELLRKILGRFLILGKSSENIWQSTNLELWNNSEIIIVINTFIFASCCMFYNVTLLLNRELVSRVKLCLVSVFPDLVKDCPKIRNIPKIFQKSFEKVAPDS